jgi:hypothetical protein
MAANSKLIGFGGGLELKDQLPALEGSGEPSDDSLRTPWRKQSKIPIPAHRFRIET